MKKLPFLLALLFVVTGCGGTSEDSLIPSSSSEDNSSSTSDGESSIKPDPIDDSSSSEEVDQILKLFIGNEEKATLLSSKNNLKEGVVCHYYLDNFILYADEKVAIAENSSLPIGIYTFDNPFVVSSSGYYSFTVDKYESSYDTSITFVSSLSSEDLKEVGLYLYINKANVSKFYYERVNDEYDYYYLNNCALKTTDEVAFANEKDEFITSYSISNPYSVEEDGSYLVEIKVYESETKVEFTKLEEPKPNKAYSLYVNSTLYSAFIHNESASTYSLENVSLTKDDKLSICDADENYLSNFTVENPYVIETTGTYKIEINANEIAACTLTSTPKEDTNTIYLVPGVWDVADVDEAYWCWVWKTGDTSGMWKDMSYVNSSWSLTLDDGYINVIFLRGSSTMTKGWEPETNYWNRTGDNKISFDTPVFTITAWGATSTAYCSGSWSAL